MLQLAEIFYSVQGEGTWTGTPAVFVRLAGCNLSCSFCDTDYALAFLASVDDVLVRETRALIEALRADGRRVHIESNGTLPAELPDDVWLTVSPKERLAPEMALRANEAKLIVDGRVPEEWIGEFPQSTRVFLQPEGNKPANVALAVDAAKRNPRRLRLSLQTHKFIGVR